MVFTLIAGPRRPRKDGQATRTAILRAERRLFVEVGYEHTTVRAIAERAGCNLALITRYFGGKAALFALIARRGPFEEVGPPLLPGVPFGSWGRTLVKRQIRLAGRTNRDDLNDLQLMLLRSASTPRGSLTLSEFLTREDLHLVPTTLAGPDVPLRIMLIRAQLVGLTMLRDIAGLPQLRDADPDAIAHYLGAAIQQLLQPDRDR